jgi:signal transduction histidine kinase
MGIQGIRERVKSAHGKVSIKGEKGSGTTIRVSIPFRKRKV